MLESEPTNIEFITFIVFIVHNSLEFSLVMYDVNWRKHEWKVECNLLELITHPNGATTFTTMLR